MQPFFFPMTISGPYGQYMIDAVVDPRAAFSSVPTPALIGATTLSLLMLRVDEETKRIVPGEGWLASDSNQDAAARDNR